MLYRLLELGFFIMFVIFVVTQMILPPFINKRFFWIFKKNEQTLEKKKDEVLSADTDVAIQAEEKRLKEKQDQLKTPSEEKIDPVTPTTPKKRGGRPKTKKEGT